MQAQATELAVQRRSGLGWRIVPMAIVGGAIGYLLVSNLLQIWTWLLGDHLSDANAYWDAAMRMRTGLPLYQPGLEADSYDLYRYAPWFAALWVPLTFLPREPVFYAWTLAMTACAVAAIIPLLRASSVAAWLLTAMLGGYLVWTGAHGNVDPLLVLLLTRTVEHRTGPLWVGIAASLKAFPIGFALVWLGRREWLKFGLAVAAAVVLTLPALALNWQDYTFNAGARPSLIPFLPLQVVASGVALGVTLALARTPYRWLAAATTIAVAAPRFVEYSLSYFLVGTAGGPEDEEPAQPAARSAA